MPCLIIAIIRRNHQRAHFRQPGDTTGDTNRSTREVRHHALILDEQWIQRASLQSAARATP